ncbi:unnamed protein product [Caenorhabditis nigoni]
MVSLLDMPDVPMNLILSHGGPSAIFSLRKVCKNLRGYIDRTIPELHLKAIGICLGYEKIEITWSHHLEDVEIGYMFHGNGYKTIVGENEKFVENVDYMEGFWNDYNLLMKFQNHSLQCFELEMSNSTKQNNVDDVSKFLKQYQNSRLIKTQYLSLGIYQGDKFPMILQHLDANCLNSIRFFGRRHYDKNIGFTEIVKLDQWKNAKEFRSDNLEISAPMKHFTHFSKINAEFGYILTEPESLNVLKEAAIRSPKFEKFIIEYHTFTESRRRLSEVFGKPFFHDDRQNKWFWFFNTCREEKILKIDNTEMSDRIYFSLIHRSMVPNGAEIKNL